jgi:hypothetical protein
MNNTGSNAKISRFSINQSARLFGDIASAAYITP